MLVLKTDEDLMDFSSLSLNKSFGREYRTSLKNWFWLSKPSLLDYRWENNLHLNNISFYLNRDIITDPLVLNQQAKGTEVNKEEEGTKARTSWSTRALCFSGSVKACRYLGDPSVKSQSAWAWQNWARPPQTDVCRSQNRPVKPRRQESSLHRPSESGRLSHCPWMQGQAVDIQVRLDTGNFYCLSEGQHKVHLTYFCHSLDHIC